jgi:Ca2+-binding EF-hand superfamily protein
MADGTYQNQINSIQGIFARFDHESTGKVKLDRVPDLIANLGRDAELAWKLLDICQEGLISYPSKK